MHEESYKCRNVFASSRSPSCTARSPTLSQRAPSANFHLSCYYSEDKGDRTHCDEITAGKPGPDDLSLEPIRLFVDRKRFQNLQLSQIFTQGVLRYLIFVPLASFPRCAVK